MHDHIRDSGIKHMLPYLRLFSAETLVIALMPWASVSRDDRALVKAELDRRLALAD